MGLKDRKDFAQNATSRHVLISLKANVPGNLVPVLLVEDLSGDAKLLKELLELSVNLLSSGWEFRSVRALSKTIGRYIDLYAAVRQSSAFSFAGLVTFTYLYADYRLNGSRDVDGSDPFGLNWQPVKWATFENDLRHIKVFSEWCSSRYGHVPLLPTERIPLSPGCDGAKALFALENQKKRDFLVHLAARRRRWQSVFPQQVRPKISLRRQQRRRKGYDEVLSEQFVRDLIKVESNPVYRALWIMASWGGVRISEQLNMWVCDVLPAVERQRFFRGDPDRDTPLVLLADPWESTWCGSVSERKASRKQFLFKNYGVVPRPDLGSAGSSDQAAWVGRAGFKGMAFHNADRLISQVYWLNNSMAEEYAEIAAEVTKFRMMRGLAARHPWLWVVTDTRKPDQIGNPLKLSSVESAFSRACQRMGVAPHRDGRSIHGLRHFYKSFARNELGLQPGTIQALMHHRSRDSQDTYGWEDMAAIRSELSRGYARIQADRTALLP